MADLEIKTIDESTVRLLGDRGLIQEISDRFTFTVPNHKFHPSVRSGIWDGKIRPVSVPKQTAPKGLVPAILDACNEMGYTAALGKEFGMFLQTIEYTPEQYNLPFELYNYQEDAIDICLRKKRAIILSSTGSGKSYIIYNIVRCIPADKILIITPRINLVTQLYSDFEDYSKNSEWDAEEHCHMIHTGADKNSSKQIYISTWQSIVNQPKSYFEQFDCVIGDEVHEFEAKSCSSILNKSVNAFFRFGFTGTLDDAKTHETVLTGMFGPIKRVSDTKDLMDKGILSKLEIRSLMLKHPEADANLVKGAKYQDEIEFLVAHKRRNDVIRLLAEKSKGNTLVLVRLIEKHGKPLFEKMKDIEGKEVHFVYGGTDSDTREKVRKLMEEKSNIIVIASIQLFSTGINIKNLFNIVLAHPTKSKIKILQSIGRGLRLHKDKEKCVLWDIGDDLRGKRKTPNHTLKHFQIRYELYKREQFSVKLIQKAI